MEKQTNRSTPVLPVYIALGLLVVFIIIFTIELAGSSGGESDVLVVETMTAETYMDIVTPLLAKGDADRGAELIVKYGCHSCHVAGAVNKLGPPFEGLVRRARIRRPPLQPAAYIYESIIHPTVFDTRGGYTGKMPLTFGNMPEQDLADIMAYLITKIGESS
ncbi:MAG: c-type cytochrome [Anaerolineae bacterium]|nr:c-type cytochrome [Anaerolineae bacterium]